MNFRSDKFSRVPNLVIDRKAKNIRDKDIKIINFGKRHTYRLLLIFFIFVHQLHIYKTVFIDFLIFHST